jgi:NhaA family Na+:H+ antiporter
MASFKIRRRRKEFIDSIRKPFEDFFYAEASSGTLLLLATVVALFIANSSLASAFERFWQTKLAIGYGDYGLSKPLILWINDGLMAIFFFFVGLEIKRELMIGELNNLKSAALPILAAFGGMLFPALLYAVFNFGTNGIDGWGIPMATDIAFALGILMLLGKRVPLGLKVFLTAVAIVDDLGAVMVIAIFYTSQLNLVSLFIGIGGVILLLTLNRFGARHPLVYGLLGIIIWVAFLKSGVHATIAGVLVAMTIPSGTRINAKAFSRRIKLYLKKFDEACAPGERLWSNQNQQEAVETIAITCNDAESPMQRMEHDLRPWVSYLIMPVFALANAGITFEAGFFQLLVQPVSMGVILGLFLGKPIGILLLSWIGIRTKLAVLPDGVGWRQLIGAGFLAGIGFTMSIFINNLAFSGSDNLDIAKGGILTGSLLAALAGVSILVGRKIKEN